MPPRFELIRPIGTVTRDGTSRRSIGRLNEREFDPAMKRPARTSYLIRQAQLITFVHVTDCLREYRITPMQYTLLSFSRRNGELSSADLARRFGITPQSMNEAISTLQRKRLLSRKEAAEHRRIQRISLTSEGGKLLKKCDRKIDAMEQKLFAALSRKEIDALRATLGKFIGSIRGSDKV
jgi:DNA-binding MarR family transcriptional regulator